MDYGKDLSKSNFKYTSSHKKATLYNSDKTHITVFPTVKSFAWNKTHYTVGLVKGDKCDDSLLWYLKPNMISDELFFFLKFLFFHNN